MTLMLQNIQAFGIAVKPHTDFTPSSCQIDLPSDPAGLHLHTKIFHVACDVCRP